MGDAKNDDLRVGFDSRLKLKFCGSQVTTAAGLLAYRELDKALRLTERAQPGRGTAEQWIKEGKNAVRWTKLSCRTFKDNQNALCNCSPWLITWATSCGGWRCPSRYGIGR